MPDGSSGDTGGAEERLKIVQEDVQGGRSRLVSLPEEFEEVLQGQARLGGKDDLQKCAVLYSRSHHFDEGEGDREVRLGLCRLEEEKQENDEYYYRYSQAMDMFNSFADRYNKSICNYMDTI